MLLKIDTQLTHVGQKLDTQHTHECVLYVGATEKITGTGNVDTINSQRNDGTVSLMLFFDLLGG